MLDLFKAIGLGLVVLLPLANPLTTVALFLGLAGNMNSAERNRQSLMASVYVFAIMMVAYYAGQLVMDTFGISIPGLRIAGGLIVAFIGFRMLFPQQKAIDSPEAKSKSEELEDEPSANIAFVPLAMPSTAGPGTIAMIISSASTVRQSSTFADWVLMVAPPLIFFLVAVILWGSLRSSGAIMRLVGKGGIEAISRLMGFLLVCMGVQFIINGILQIAFAHCLRMTLRKQPQAEVLAHYLKTEDLQPVLASNSPANRILLIMGEWLAVQRRNGQLSDIQFISLNDRLNDISAVLAGCERIAYTPIPFAYTLILHRTVYLFCIMLPFALVVDLHYMTPFISVLISYTFISLDCLAEELEDPFGTENNDLPLDAICNAIEIDLLQMNDEAEIPAKILPDRHYQLT